jgi:hypothetical protein
MKHPAAEVMRSSFTSFIRESAVATAAALGVIAAATALPACSDPKPEPTLHEQIVCAPSAGAGVTSEVACDVAGRAAAFDGWLQDAQYRPGSTFEVLVVGSDRSSSRRLANVCIPATFGRNVAEAKAAFVRDARQRVVASDVPASDRTSATATCSPSGAGAGAVHSVRVVGGASPIAAVATAPAHASVLCDLSTSAGGLVCTTRTVQRAYDRWMSADGAAEAGATFRVEVIGRTRDTVHRRFDVVVPAASPGERVAYVLGARAELARASFAADKDTGSAVAEALHLVAKQLKEANGHATITLLSDLRQVGGGWNFEVRVPAPGAFTESLRQQGLIADLHGVPVIACIHEQGGPGARPFDAKLAGSLENAWKHSLSAMGATEVRILSDCDGALAAR